MTEPASKGRAAAAPTEEGVAAAEEAAQAAATQAALDAYGDLAKAIVWVTGKIKSVPKNGFNNHHSYSYATKDDIIEALKPLMEQAGLAVVPHFRGAERGPEDSRGYVDLFANWDMQILHRSGGTLMVSWQSESMDNSDKNINKAITAAKKSFYRAVFDIPDGEPDAEHTSNAVSREGGERSSRQEKNVGVKTLLQYKADNSIQTSGYDWVLARLGFGPGTKLVDVPKDRLAEVMQGFEFYVAERAKRDPETGEPKSQESADAPLTQPGDPLPADWDDIPF